MSGDSLGGRGVWGIMDTCVCVAELLCCAPETIITLLIGYNTIQNKTLEEKNLLYELSTSTQ